MNITIKGTHTDLSPALNQNIETKLSALEKFSKPEDKIHVELEDMKHVDGNEFRAEIRVSPHGYYADATGQDFYEAVDLVIPKVLQQMQKAKEKRVSLKRRAGALWKRFLG